EPFLKINYALRQLLARPASPSSLRRYSRSARRPHPPRLRKLSARILKKKRKNFKELFPYSF
ncbi:hypothetical protein KJ836_01215, partial [Patescibacteria group bacterium]|nr:hypothetical protein [Patescibacteria group bacterium]